LRESDSLADNEAPLSTSERHDSVLYCKAACLLSAAATTSTSCGCTVHHQRQCCRVRDTTQRAERSTAPQRQSAATMVDGCRCSPQRQSAAQSASSSCSLVHSLPPLCSHGGVEAALDGRDAPPAAAALTLNEVEPSHAVASQSRLRVATHVARHILHDIPDTAEERERRSVLSPQQPGGAGDSLCTRCVRC
jgi:hypothetical protein